MEISFNADEVKNMIKNQTCSKILFTDKTNLDVQVYTGRGNELRAVVKVNDNEPEKPLVEVKEEDTQKELKKTEEQKIEEPKDNRLIPKEAVEEQSSKPVEDDDDDDFI